MKQGMPWLTSSLASGYEKVTIVPNGEWSGCCFGYVKIPPLDGEITPSTVLKVEQEIVVFFAGALSEK